jgi:hypothetical protein
MRHSVSIPFNALLATHETTASGTQETYTTLLGSNELRKVMVDLLDKSGRNGEEVIDLILRGEQTVVASCGSGMTAAVIWLALQEMGVNRTVPLYDEVCMDIISEVVNYVSISRADRPVGYTYPLIWHCHTKGGGWLLARRIADDRLPTRRAVRAKWTGGWWIV